MIFPPRLILVRQLGIEHLNRQARQCRQNAKMHYKTYEEGGAMRRSCKADHIQDRTPLCGARGRARVRVRFGRLWSIQWYTIHRRFQTIINSVVSYFCSQHGVACRKLIDNIFPCSFRQPFSAALPWGCSVWLGRLAGWVRYASWRFILYVLYPLSS